MHTHIRVLRKEVLYMFKLYEYEYVSILHQQIAEIPGNFMLINFHIAKITNMLEPYLFNATPLFLWHRKRDYFMVQCLPLTVSESAR